MPSSIMDFFNVLPFAKREGGGEESDSSCHSRHEGKLQVEETRLEKWRGEIQKERRKLECEIRVQSGERRKEAVESRERRKVVQG